MASSLKLEGLRRVRGFETATGESWFLVSPLRGKSPFLYLMVTCGALVEAGLIATWVFPLMPADASSWPVALSPGNQYLDSGIWLHVSGGAVVGLIALAFSWAGLRRPSARWMPVCALVAWVVAGGILWGWLSLTVALPVVLALAAAVASAVQGEAQGAVGAAKPVGTSDPSRRESFTPVGRYASPAGARPSAAPGVAPPASSRDADHSVDGIDITFED